MLDASPLNEAEALIVPVAALPPDTVVPSDVVVPYSNFGVVDVEPAEIVPLRVAEVDPIAVGLFVLIEISVSYGFVQVQHRQNEECEE